MATKNGKVKSEDVASKPIQKTRKGETLLPYRIARDGPYERILKLPLDEQYDAVNQMERERRAHPDTTALECVEAYLTAAHLHSDLEASPELSKLVFVFREVLADFVPGETAIEALEPLHAFLSRHGGGRRPVHVIWREWSERNENKKLKKPMLSARERYEDIAAEWEAEGHSPKKWTAIRDGISDLKKLEKAGKVNRV